MPARKERPPTITDIKNAESKVRYEAVRASDDYVSPIREYPPVGEPEKLGVDDPEFMSFIDAEMDKLLGTTPVKVIPLPPDVTPDLVEIAKEVFKDMLAEKENPEVAKSAAAPGRDKMLPLSGGLYLPVRRRVAWMRGEPSQHQDWGIHTTVLKYEIGELVAERGGGPGGKMPEIKGGYAIVKAEVVDQLGRIISQSTATERSELFPDFIEKAETAAVGRAMALAGYGTETALDIDEGLDEENIADAPVRPIVIGGSGVEGVLVGGRTPNITNAQLKEIARLVKSIEMKPDGVASLITDALGIVIPEEALVEESVANTYIVSVLRGLTNEQAKVLLKRLMELDEMASG